MYLPPHVLVRFNAFVQCTNAHHYERERERERDKRGGGIINKVAVDVHISLKYNSRTAVHTHKHCTERTCRVPNDLTDLQFQSGD